MVCVSSHISGASLALNILPRPAAESPFGILVADRIFRFGPAPDSAGHAHAIARMCAGCRLVTCSATRRDARGRGTSTEAAASMQMLLILTFITLVLIPVMQAMAATAAQTSFRPAQRGRCFEDMRRDVAGAPASLPRGCPTRLLIAFPTVLGTESDPVAPSASSLRTASFDSDPPLIPPVTHTRSLAWAPEGRLVTCSATRRDARGRYRTKLLCRKRNSATTPTRQPISAIVTCTRRYIELCLDSCA